MLEIWLRPNRRVFLLGLVPGAAISLAAIALVLITPSAALRYFGLGMLVLGLLLLGVVLKQFLRPRIAYDNGRVLFYLRADGPIAVPVHVVEAFFLGQGPAYLPGTVEDSQETVNLVARLSQKEPQWQHVDVKPALGRWCEGYVSIRGTWCEPLNKEVVRRLNRRLNEVSREVSERVQ